MHNEYVSICMCACVVEYYIGGGRQDGIRDEREISCVKTVIALTVVSIIRRKTYATIQEKKEIFHVLAKQQQTNDKRVCR